MFLNYSLAIFKEMKSEVSKFASEIFLAADLDKNEYIQSNE
jgi:hypothetical protein